MNKVTRYISTSVMLYGKTTNSLDAFKPLLSSGFLKFSNSNLLFLEGLHIKFKKPELNSDLKASKELVVFP